jgi:HK97 family phage portal protein
MGIKSTFEAAFRPQREENALPLPFPLLNSGRAAWPDNRYPTLAKEGYMANEVVFACIEELSTSAAEPRLRIRRRNSEEFITRGHPLLDGDGRNGLNLSAPNPFQDRFEFFATIIMHRALAGNAYTVIERNNGGKPIQMWPMRPDRVKVVPHETKHISHYEYDIGLQEPLKLPVEDVIHWKTRHPLNDYYGLAPLEVGAGRVDIDNFLRDFTKTYFQRAGMPSALLALKNKTSDDVKRQIVDRYNGSNSGPANWHGLLVVENTEATFTPMTNNLGAAGAMGPEVSSDDIKRICALFQVPPEILSLSDSATSYAALVEVQRFFWDNTLSPLYEAIIGPLNLRLTPNYPDIAEIAWDFSRVRALQEDIDKVHNRTRADAMAGLLSLQEARAILGMTPELPTGHIFLIPGNMAATPTERVGEEPEPPAPQPALTEGVPE